MNKLYIDTCTGELLIGIKTADQTKVFDNLTAKKTAETMFPVLQDLLQEVGMTFKDIEAVYVTKGPGSYTGSRLGLTLAKVLKVLNPTLRIYTCSTLQALLAAYNHNDGLALINARNGAFFASADISDENDGERLEGDEVLAKIESGLIPVIYHLDSQSAEELKNYGFRGVNPLDGMLSNEHIFCEVCDANLLKPFYLKGRGRE